MRILVQIMKDRYLRLKMLNEYYDDLGIGLYRAVEVNGAMTGWERMTLNENNNPAFTNCNQL